MGTTYRNTSVHPIDLPDGRTLAPGEAIEEGVDDEDPFIEDLKTSGLLTMEHKPEGKAKSGSSRKTEGEEE